MKYLLSIPFRIIAVLIWIVISPLILLAHTFECEDFNEAFNSYIDIVLTIIIGDPKMSITLSQVEKVLRKAGVSYMRSCNTIDVTLDPLTMFLICEKKDFLVVDINQGFVTYDFNSLKSDGKNLLFSYKGQEPLIVKIR